MALLVPQQHISFDATTQEIHIRIPCSALDIAAASPSKSGRSNIVAETGGYIPIDTSAGRVKVQVYCITK